VFGFYEDLAVGSSFTLGSHTFGADAIKAFARQFDPQAFHLDEAAAQRSPYGRLIASGWHTATMWMGAMLDCQSRDNAARRARGEPVPQLGPSPGFRELRWLKPVYVGDTLTYATEVIDKRPSVSRPRWGLMTLRNTATNQNGELALSWVSTAFIERRTAGGGITP
jgi:acyl dehydratase